MNTCVPTSPRPTFRTSRSGLLVDFGGGASAIGLVSAFGDAEEVEHLSLEGGEFWLLGVQDGLVVGDEVPPGEAAEADKGFDAALVLEQRRGDLEHALEVPEVFLDGGLALVGVEHVGRLEGAVVGQQRVLRRVPDHAAWLGERPSGGPVHAFGGLVGAA